MSRLVRVSGLAGTLLASLVASSMSLADDKIVEQTGKCIISFAVRTPILGSPATTPVTVYLTDDKKKDLDVEGWPRDVTAKKFEPGYVPEVSEYDAKVNIPKEAQKKNETNPIVMVKVSDFRFSWADTVGKKVSMDIESIQHDAVAGYSIANVFGQIAQVVGMHIPVTVPAVDSLATADFYGLVDLNIFLFATPPSVAKGDVLAVSNGQSPALPGMFFSSTPFDLDPLTGLSYTPYSGDVQVNGSTILTATPEPSSLLLAGLAWAGLGRRLGRRTAQKSRQGLRLYG